MYIKQLVNVRLLKKLFRTFDLKYNIFVVVNKTNDKKLIVPMDEFIQSIGEVKGKAGYYLHNFYAPI